eukprot:TRINITY_DN27527_c0_g1_i1.p1 TRINITY_DN27527_c0_g1~~TRINITY_DN27527_c0_g1_i1.p1  ORF type:complete len:292 (+),score=67.69 TRINITY_DN27527_c0_g1_i1:73-876(+)
MASESSREAKKRFLREAKETSAAANAAGRGRRQASGGDDVFESSLLPAFDRAIAAATANARMNPEDQHQVWALRKAKKAVIEHLKAGNDSSLGALHTLTGVGHWVVGQVRAQLEAGPGASEAAAKKPRAGSAPPPTPNSFTWWYLDASGKFTKFQNSAETAGSPGMETYRVCISHASGRMEKAWLPASKAPPQSQGAPPSAETSTEEAAPSTGRKRKASSPKKKAPPIDLDEDSPDGADNADNAAAATSVEQLSAEEMRRRRLARFG